MSWLGTKFKTWVKRHETFLWLGQTSAITPIITGLYHNSLQTFISMSSSLTVDNHWRGDADIITSTEGDSSVRVLSTFFPRAKVGSLIDWLSMAAITWALILTYVTKKDTIVISASELWGVSRLWNLTLEFEKYLTERFPSTHTHTLSWAQVHDCQRQKQACVSREQEVLSWRIKHPDQGTACTYQIFGQQASYRDTSSDQILICSMAPS